MPYWLIQNWNPKPEARSPKSETRNPKLETRNLEPETETWNPKPETRNPKRQVGRGGRGALLAHPELVGLGFGKPLNPTP